MKIHVYGNTLNSAFHLTKNLRDRGVDAEMFLDNSSPKEQDFPWWDDKSLSANSLPSWLHYYPVFPNFLFPGGKTRQLIRDFSKCDVALVSCYGPMLAMKAKIPFVFHSLGSDLNMIDFKDDLKMLLFNTSTFKAKIGKFFKLMTYGRMQARALKSHANRIIIFMGYQYFPYIINYNLQSKTVKIPYPKDIISYGVAVNEQFYEQYKNYDSVFFMFARHGWRSIWNDTKGNDKFIRSFARFVKEKSPNVVLLMTKKGVDAAASEALVKELGIEKYVRLMDDMPKYKLKEYQAMPNIVMVDNFWHDRLYDRYPDQKDKVKTGFGFGAMESLASKSLLITAFKDHEFYGGESPPILDAFTEEEIYERLLQLNAMSLEERNQMRQAGYDFALKWHEQTNVIHKYISVLREVYSEVQNRV